MNQNKIACNASNSAAVDSDGNLYVWGSGRTGILGKIDKINFQNNIPERLPIERLEKKGSLSFNNKTVYKVEDISMGVSHISVIASDADTNDKNNEFKTLDEAEGVFKQLKRFFIRHFNQNLLPGLLAKKEYKPEQLSERQKEKIILTYAIQSFYPDPDQKPFVNKKSFQILLFQTAQVKDTESINIDKLYSDLANHSQHPGQINLKEVRDQMLGRRSNTGLVFAWGINDERTCNGLREPSESPFTSPERLFDDDLIFVKTKCNILNTFGLTKEGYVYVWGLVKQSGSERRQEFFRQKLFFAPDAKEQYEVERMESEEIRITQIACGTSHQMALTEHGKIYSWGNGQVGKLGHGDTAGKTLPCLIIDPCFKNKKVIQIECGDSHSGCITEDGLVFVWGNGLNGRLGNSMMLNRSTPLQIFEGNRDIQKLCFGMSSSFAIDRSGGAFSWGSGQSGKLGHQETSQMLMPRQIQVLKRQPIYEFACGPFHTLALTDHGILYVFGSCKDGKLGISGCDHDINQPTALKQKFFQGEKDSNFRAQYPQFNSYNNVWALAKQQVHSECHIIQTVCSEANTYFLLSTGSVYACGRNDMFQCTKLQDEEQEEVMLSLTNRIKEVREEVDRSFEIFPAALRKQLDIELGIQRFRDIEKPTQLHIYSDINSVSSLIIVNHIAAGAMHVMVTSVQGEVFGWGSNEFGQLGIGKPDGLSVKTPIHLKIDTPVRMCAAGSNHTLFLTKLGKVYACGLNEFGQLGFKSESLKEQSRNLQAKQSNKNIHENFLAAKIQNFPIFIGLSCIGFIACGQNHSLAITNANQPNGQALQLYSWGWSNQGQVGNAQIRNNFNIDNPTQVKFPNNQRVQVVMASAASRHTLVLDIDCQLWYFGNKKCVGIEDDKYPLQFEPARILNSGVEKRYQFVAAGDDSNLVISLHDQFVYQFGRHKPQKTDATYNGNHHTDFEKVQYGNKQYLRAQFVSCGREHYSAVCLKEGMPYCWGNNANYRCGVNLDDPQLELGDSYIDEEIISLPVQVTELVQLLIDKQNYANELKTYQHFKQIDQPNQKKTSQWRFPVQAEIKNDTTTYKQIVQQDEILIKEFKSLCSEFHDKLTQINAINRASLMRCQDAVITRVDRMPAPVQLLDQIFTDLPKFILKNRPLFEMIFTLLQTHPCYLQNIITKTEIWENPNKASLVIQAVFGANSILDNMRVLQTLKVIALKNLDFELKSKDVLQFTMGETTHFKTIFDIIFHNQTQNRKLVQGIVKDILKCTYDQKKKRSLLSQVVPFLNQPVGVTQENFLDEFGQDLISILVASLKIITNGIQFKQLSGFYLISSEVTDLLICARAKLTESAGPKYSKIIDTYLINMLMSEILTKLDEISSVMQIELEYCCFPDCQEVLQEIFQIGRAEGILKQVYSCLSHYFNSKLNEIINNEELHFLVEFGYARDDKKQQLFRDEVIKFLMPPEKKVDYTMSLVYQMFKSSCDREKMYLTVSIEKLVYIWNLLTQNKDSICLKGNGDPLRFIINELGSKPIPATGLQGCINLQIEHRLLLNDNEFNKCIDCYAPVSRSMATSQSRFDESFLGKAWKCKTGCKVQKMHNRDTYFCDDCYSTMPDQMDLVFKRFAQKKLEPKVERFQEILKTIPLVSDDQDFMEVLDHELIKLEQVMDLRKKSQMEFFKQEIVSYIDEHLISQEEQQLQNAVTIQSRILQDNFLRDLMGDLEQEIKNKKSHFEYARSLHAHLKEMHKWCVQATKSPTLDDKTFVMNCYTGLSSQFLEKFLHQYQFFSGQFHKKTAKNQNQIQAKKRNRLQQNQDRINTFYQELHTTKAFFSENDLEESKHHQIVQRRPSVGKYSCPNLKKDGIIISCKSHDEKTIRSCFLMILHEIKDGISSGFSVELLFEELTFVCGKRPIPIVLDKFSISDDALCEMRRNMCNSASVIFGPFIFDNFRLVKLINTMISQNDIFNELRHQLDDIDTEKTQQKKAYAKHLTNETGYDIDEDVQKKQSEKEKKNKKGKK